MPLWLPPNSGQIVDVKGDLIVGTANDTVDRLAVGGTGATLSPDASQATGMRWKAAVNGRIIGTTTTVSKYRASWAIVPLGAAAHVTGCTAVAPSAFNGGLSVNETGTYLVEGTVGIPVSCALAIAKNAPSSNVDAGPYLITTHLWQYDPSALGYPKHITEVVDLVAFDTVHLGIYTGATETYTADVNAHSLTIARIA